MSRLPLVTGYLQARAILYIHMTKGSLLPALVLRQDSLVQLVQRGKLPFVHEVELLHPLPVSGGQPLYTYVARTSLTNRKKWR